MGQRERRQFLIASGALLAAPLTVRGQHAKKVRVGYLSSNPPSDTQAAIVATRSQLPAMYHLRQYLEVGGLMAYGPTYIESFQQSAVLVDKIVKGARPAELPIEQPWRYELAVNLKAAKTLGLTIPQSVLMRADLVVE